MAEKGKELQEGLGWFMGRWRRVFERMDKDAIAAEVRQLAEKHPDESVGQLARRVVRGSARGSAIVGAATAGPALIPGVGTALSIASIVPEEIYLIKKQVEMLLRLAVVYGFDPHDEERLFEIVMLARSPTTPIEVMMAAKYDLRRVAAKAAVQVGRSASKRSLLGLKAASRGLVRRLPALGFFAGSAINYWSFNSLGKQGIRFYARKNGAATSG